MDKKVITLELEQTRYLQMLVNADLKARSDDHRHAVAYGVDYDDSLLNVGAGILFELE